jgi:hypothetical protein
MPTVEMIRPHVYDVFRHASEYCSLIEASLENDERFLILHNVLHGVQTYHKSEARRHCWH